MNSFIGVSIFSHRKNKNSTSLFLKNKRFLTDILALLVLIAILYSIFYFPKYLWPIDQKYDLSTSKISSPGEETDYGNSLYFLLRRLEADTIIQELSTKPENKIRESRIEAFWTSCMETLHRSLLINLSSITINTNVLLFSLLVSLFVSSFFSVLCTTDYRHFFKVFSLCLCIFILLLSVGFSFYKIFKIHELNKKKYKDLDAGEDKSLYESKTSFPFSYTLSLLFFFSALINFAFITLTKDNTFPTYLNFFRNVKTPSLLVRSTLLVSLLFAVLLLFFLLSSFTLLKSPPSYSNAFTSKDFAGETSLSTTILKLFYIVGVVISLGSFFICYIYSVLVRGFYSLYIQSIERYFDSFNYVPFRETFDSLCILLWNSGTIFAIGLGNSTVYSFCQMILGISTMIAHKENIVFEAILVNLMCLTANMRIVIYCRRLFDKLNLCCMATKGSDFLVTAKSNAEQKGDIFGDVHGIRAVGSNLKNIINFLAASAGLCVFLVFYKAFYPCPGRKISKEQDIKSTFNKIEIYKCLKLEGFGSSLDIKEIEARSKNSYDDNGQLEDFLCFIEGTNPCFVIFIVFSLTWLFSNLCSTCIEALCDGVVFCHAETKKIAIENLLKKLPISSFLELDKIRMLKNISKKRHKKLFAKVMRRNKQILKKQNEVYRKNTPLSLKYNFSNIDEIRSPSKSKPVIS